jgi:hypothetical protein
MGTTIQKGDEIVTKIDELFILAKKAGYTIPEETMASRMDDNSSCFSSDR